MLCFYLAHGGKALGMFFSKRGFAYFSSFQRLPQWNRIGCTAGEVLDAAWKPLRPRIVVVLDNDDSKPIENRVLAIRAASNLTQFSSAEMALIEETIPVSPAAPFAPPMLVFFTRQRYVKNIQKFGLYTPEALGMLRRTHQKEIVGHQ